MGDLTKSSGAHFLKFVASVLQKLYSILSEVDLLLTEGPFFLKFQIIFICFQKNSNKTKNKKNS